MHDQHGIAAHVATLRQEQFLDLTKLFIAASSAAG